MKQMVRLWESMLARRALSIALCVVLVVTSGGVCIASTNHLIRETRAAGENEGQPEGGAKTAEVQKETQAQALQEPPEPEGEPLEDDTRAEEEPEDTRCIHEFTAAWVGYECKLTDFIEGYEPGDEVRISASFNKPVTSQLGLYIDGAWNSFRGEGKRRNITLVPDSDYLNIQISDLKGQASVNLTEVSAEIVRKGEADTGSYLHKFTGLWQGFETKFSDFNPDYEPGDEIRVTVNYSKYVSSQLGMNIGGEWSTLAGEGKELVREMTPDNDYLNIQITDMWANYKVGIISVSVDILKKGPGVSGYGGGGGRLAATRYTEPGDYVLFSGDANEKYETNDGWLLDCADTDWITLKYSCVPEHENWGIMGWGATVDGQWVDGPGYSADSSDSTKAVTQTFSVKYLRRMMGITPESDVSYLNLGCYSEGRIEEMTLHVGSEIPREASLFKDGAPNEAWVCTDIERILDAADDKYLCVQYRCAVSDFNGWTILNWGASVNGEWKNGKSYKASYKDATREKIISMRMDAFRNMLHLSWDVKVDSIQLAAYNDAQILDIWISDDKVEDPGEEKKEKEVREASYHSSNSNAYGQIIRKDGIKYDQDIFLENWEWRDLKGAWQIIRGLGENIHLILEFEAEDGDEPTLQFSMVDGKQQGVKPTYVLGNQALFSFGDIQEALADYMIPQEISNLQVSAGEGKMTIKTVKVIEDDTDLEQDPIGVLTESWSGFGTQISKWHSDYEPGKDTVKVTVTFDKPAPGSIAFNMGGVWNNGGSMNSATITRTAKPDDDYLGIQLGEMPKGKSHVLITDIKVEIVGKINFDEHVKVEGKRSIGMLASAKKEAATAVLSDEEIKRGMKVVFDIKDSSLSAKEQADVKALFGGQAGKVGIAKVVDINVYKEDGGKRTKVTQTDDPVSFKVSVPDELQNKGYDFAVVEDHGGEKIFLEKLDGNPSTVTFASSKFSKFAVVYGEAGAFDSLSGALTVFRKEWSGWETTFSRYLKDFEAGRPATVTLTFDREVKPNIVYYSPWTRVESDAAKKTFQATVVPTEDKLEIALSSLNGHSMAKLMGVKVEQEKEAKPETVHTFKKNASGQYDHFNFKLSDYGNFAVGDAVKVTIKMSSESGFNGAVGTNENGSWKDKAYTAGSDNYVGEAVWEGIPDADSMQVQLHWSGAGIVDIDSIHVEKTGQADTSIHIFRKNAEDTYDEYVFKLSDYGDYAAGEPVKVTIKMSSSSGFNGTVGTNEGGKWKNSDYTTGGDVYDVEAAWEGTPDADSMHVQLYWAAAETAEILSIHVEKTGQADTSIHTFQKNAENTYDEYVFKLSDYGDYAAGEPVKVTIKMSSPSGFNGTVGTNEGGKWKNSDYTTSGDVYDVEAVWEGTPDADSMHVQLYWAAAETAEILSIRVEKTGQADTSIHTFRKNTADTYDEYVFKLSDYGDYASGEPVKVTIKMSSSSGFNGTVGTNEGGKWKNNDYTTSGDTYDVEAVWEGTPDADSMHIQLYWAAAETAEIHSIRVEKNPGSHVLVLDDMIQSEDYVYMFHEPETIILDLADYFDEYEEGQGVAIEMNLFSDGNFCAMVEDADYVTAKIPDPPSGDKTQDEEPDEELPLASASNAEPVTATASNAMPATKAAKAKAKPRGKAADTASQEKAQPGGGLPVATASNAEAAEATPSNASPAGDSIAVGSRTAAKTSKAAVYESEEDGTLMIKWFGNPQSGSIAVTVLDMDGTQVKVDTMDVEEKAGAVSVKNVVTDTAADMASPGQKKEDSPVEQDPAKKEDSLEESLYYGKVEGKKPGEPEKEPGESEEDPEEAGEDPGESEGDPEEAGEEPGESEEDPEEAGEEPGESEEEPDDPAKDPGKDPGRGED